MAALIELDQLVIPPTALPAKNMVGGKNGQGQRSTVYKTIHKVLGSVVVKSFFTKDEKQSKLSPLCEGCPGKVMHPNIVQLHGYVVEDGVHYPVSEFVSGLGSLDTFLGDEKSRSWFMDSATWPRRLQMALDVARGLNYLHSLDSPVILGDLHPRDVLVRDNFTLVINDAFISRSFGTKTAWRVDQFLAFVAPECKWNTDDRIAPTAKADVFGIGILLCLLGTGQIRFDAKLPMKGLLNNAIQRWLAEGKRPVFTSSKSIPEGYEKLVNDCWDQEPTKRPSVQEIIARLVTMLLLCTK